MRVAAIDLGTNTTRLLVADVEDGLVVDEVVRRTQITRLGEGVDSRRRLLPLPIARVRNCLAEYRREIEALGSERTLLAATSAVRDAENGEAFLGEIEWSYGFTTRLLGGDEEAELTLRGVGSPEGALVVDIGGGSTELIGAGLHESLDIGSVRLTERSLPSDPPTEEELADAAATVRELLPNASRPERAIGVAGTITSLAALDIGLVRYDADLVHGHHLSIEGVQRQFQRLAGMRLALRRGVPALEPERAPVIVGGAVILREVMAHFGLEEIETSVRDILHGIALEAAALPEPVEGDAPPGAYTCC